MSSATPKTTLFYNPDCSKCQEAMCLLDDSKVEYEIVEYLTDVPTVDDLRRISEALKLPPMAFMRTGEPEFQQFYAGKELSDEECYEAMTRYPKLIERPILVQGNKAIIGRPPSRILDLI
ncbi:MAG: hypothetical protein K0R65_1171 [Crocinitomicaceae bacterium]|jgi:arsenate reductase|nr:hypothetical protein [Crocinitomicaceae bacterium]